MPTKKGTGKPPAAGKRGRKAKSDPETRPRKTAPRKKKKPEAEAVEPEIVEAELVDADEDDDIEPDAGEKSAGAERLLAPGEEGPVDPDKALVHVTPLQRYLMEIRRIPLLSREEEYDLAVAFRDRDDIDSAYKLVTSNLRLVVKISMEFQRSFVNVMDLIQEGNIGLMQAVQKFDPYKNVKLSSYAAWWIKAYILRYILNNWRMVKIGTTQAQRKLFYNLQKEKERLEAQGFTPSTALLAERLDVTQKEVVEMGQRLGQPEVSLDVPVGEDGASTVLDLIPSAETTPDDAVIEAHSLAHVRDLFDEFVETLEGKERFIFEMRMIAEDPLTLQQIGDHFGVTRERIHQIESGLQKRLKAFLEERGIVEA